MIVAILVFFLLAAIFGAVLLTYVLTDKRAPRLVMLLHGACAATGLILLIIYAWQNIENKLFLVIGIFIIVALAGFYMATKELTQKPVPKAVAIIHGTLAASGLLLFIYFVFF